MGVRHPPFKIPPFIKNGANYQWIERKIIEVSDGDQTEWPAADSGYRPSAHEYYLCHLGQRWAENDGLGQHGYATFEIDQPGGPQTYKRLFGHPTGRFYDSVLKFEPHFLWLMSEMEHDCTCTLCNKKPLVSRPRLAASRIELSPKLQARSEPTDDEDQDNDGSSMSDLSNSNDNFPTRRTQRRLKQSGQPFAQDEEGDEDIYKDCIRSLEVAKGSSKITEIELVEEDSIDWKAERSILPQYFTQLEQQHSFIPRVGELVLWCPTWPQDQYLMHDKDTMEYKFYSFQTQKFCGFPNWRGGVVTATPSNTARGEAVDFADILQGREKQSSLSNSGFRVETMPDPNNDWDKSLSKQYKHVPLRNIRPLSHWKLLLRGTPVKHQHESIAYALTCMTTISLLEKWLFLGDWPKATIYCKGIYLGPEMIAIGDTIRIRGNTTSKEIQEQRFTDVMVVSSVRYNLEEISQANALPNTPTLSGRSFITLVGQAYTTDEQRSHGSAKQLNPTTNGTVPLQAIKEGFKSVGANEYGPWYPLHTPNQKLEISHEQVLGRLYEADAVRLWMGQRQHASHKSDIKPSLDFDADGIITGRAYASASDARLPEPQHLGDINWYLADTRAQSLAIASLNNIELAGYHNIRDHKTLKRWRDAVRTAEGRGTSNSTVNENGMISWSEVIVNEQRRGRPAGSKIVDGKVIFPGPSLDSESHSYAREEPKLSSQMADAALVSDDDDDNDSRSNDSSNHRKRDDAIRVAGTRRRGRPTGSKVVNGKLVLPDQPVQTEDDSAEELRLSSQMATTAIVSDGMNTSDESEGFQDYEEKDDDSESNNPKRRGRPLGSKVINGKLVLPGQTVQMDDRVGERSRQNDQTLGLALVSDHEFNPSQSGDSRNHRGKDNHARNVNMPRRGRPAGSKVVNGRLVLPGQSVLTDSRPKVQQETQEINQVVNPTSSLNIEDSDSWSEESLFFETSDDDSGEEDIET